ncbi:hypothetical protein NL676_013160 [Syzygium grande]|nr:hypothetical protein NL676_013160 [Syzygium grande]
MAADGCRSWPQETHGVEVEEDAIGRPAGEEAEKGCSVDVFHMQKMLLINDQLVCVLDYIAYLLRSKCKWG